MGEAVMKGKVTVSGPADASAIIHFSGKWQTGAELQGADEALGILALKPLLRTVSFDASELMGWDSNLLTFLIKIKEYLEKRGIDCRTDALPEGARRLLKLAAAVPERQETKKDARSEPFLSRIGGRAITLAGSAGEVFAFLGEATMALLTLFRGRASFRRSDVFLFFQESGVQALPIVSLISVLFGLILAFVGAIQLQTFEAQIYVADLVGIAMVRVIGAVMTGINI